MIVFFGAFLVWIVCACAAMSIASSKGQGGCAGFALGFLLGPLGVIIVACLPASDRALVRAAQLTSGAEVGAQKTCPHCRSRVPEAATVCRFCQRDLPAAITAANCTHPTWKPGPLYYLLECATCGYGIRKPDGWKP